MELQLKFFTVSVMETVSQIKQVVNRKSHKSYINSYLNLLFIPILFALTTYAVDYTEVQNLKFKVDPIINRIPGVEGSQIGSCIQGTDQNPFQKPAMIKQNVDVCIVYLVKNENLIPKLRQHYKNLKLQTPIAIRFQKI